jgi:hypothetical protein
MASAPQASVIKLHMEAYAGAPGPARRARGWERRCQWLAAACTATPARIDCRHSLPKILRPSPARTMQDMVLPGFSGISPATGNKHPCNVHSARWAQTISLKDEPTRLRTPGRYPENRSRSSCGRLAWNPITARALLVYGSDPASFVLMIWTGSRL